MLLSYIIEGAALVVIYFCFLFLVTRFNHNLRTLDVGWGIGFILVTFYTLFKNGSYLSRQILITQIVCIWAIRLSGHLILRGWGKKEDPRYEKLKQRWRKNNALMVFLFIFIPQAIILYFVSAPIILINASYTPGLGTFAGIGFIVWLIGLIFESVADYQLYVFQKTNMQSDAILNQGLWKYSRHPNYFGEILIWSGIALIALPVPLGWVAFISPLLIILVLYKFSGPITEKLLSQNPAYKVYQQKTNMIIPGIPKN